MRHVLRAVGGGAALGTAFFVAPVLGQVVVGVGLLGIAARLLGAGRGRAARRAAWQAAFAQQAGPLPIDEPWPGASSAPEGPAYHIAVS